MAQDFRASRHTIDLSEEGEEEHVEPLLSQRTTRSQTRRISQREPVLPETAAEESTEVEESAEEDVAPEGIGNEVADEGVDTSRKTC